MSEKTEFKQKVEDQLNDWENQLDKLKAKASDATDDLKEKYNEAISELEPKIAEGKAKLKEW